MAIQNYAESWTDNYDKYKSVVNFVAGDFSTLKDAIRRYIALQNPENYNDWAESSEVGMFANGLAYLGESLHYRVDLNAHDIFPSTTERRQSLLNFAKMLSYSPKRNIGALGIAKLISIQTSQSVRDTAGNLLKDVPIVWNDASNKNWLEQFLTVINASFVSNNPFGKPLKKESVNGTNTQLYELNNIANNKAVYSFTASVNGTTQQFEVVNADINTTDKTIFERNPMPEQAFHILYRNDGTGNASKNTGFFVYWKQGSLQADYTNFDQKIENNSYEITTKNINEYDVWVQELDGETGLVKNNWTKIANDEYLVYNNTDSTIRNIFKVETRENDTIIVRFSDGKFGTIPVGIFRFWYRVSQGNANLYIKPADIKNVSVRIPYKSNNTTDDNVYYLTMNFSVQDISHIRQSVQQESLEYIRTRSPQVYSTQNRMVTGKDYNYFPKAYGQQLRVIKAIERTYAGNSRYIKFNDPTGTYQDVNVLAEDGYIYEKNTLYSNNFIDDGVTDYKTIVDKNILPMISSIKFDNFFYRNFSPLSYGYTPSGSSERKTMIWSEIRSDGTNTSRGKFKYVTITDNPYVPYSSIVNQLYNGSFVRFTSPNYNGDVWVEILEMKQGDNDYDYEIVINETLDEAYEWQWSLNDGYNPLIKSFSENVYSRLKSKIDGKLAFGLAYDYSNRTWVLLDGEQLANENESFIYSDDFEGENLRNWLFRASYESPNTWTFKIRYLDYIFGSQNKVAFFFNEDEKLNNSTGFYTRDYIKVLQLNTRPDGTLFKEDYYWKPLETIKYSDGYTDTHQVKVYGYDSDKDSSIDNPVQFLEMSSKDLKDLYFFKEEGSDIDTFVNNVNEIDTMWTHTTQTGLFNTQIPCTIYPAGTYLPHDVTITKTVKLSNGEIKIATPENPITFEQLNENQEYNTYKFDIVDEYKEVTWDLDAQGHPTNVQEVIVEGPQLIKWSPLTNEMTRYVYNTDYYTCKGISNLKFIWEHFASSNYVIDPCPTNIIDMYVLTTSYYNAVQNWLMNGKNGTFPKLLSAYEMKSMFRDLDNYSMVSDSLVWHPIKYKLLFGNEADSEYKAKFNVIKNEFTTMSDNEVKQAVVEAIDTYFSSMEAGEKFFFTQLSTYIHERLGNNIGTVVIVPQYSDNKFGNLFEIACSDDEILLSTASIDDINIISKITANNTKIGN